MRDRDDKNDKVGDEDVTSTANMFSHRTPRVTAEATWNFSTCTVPV